MPAKKTSVDLTSPLPLTRGVISDGLKTVLQGSGFTCSSTSDFNYASWNGLGAGPHTASVFTAVNETAKLYLRVVAIVLTIAGQLPGIYIYFQHSPDNTFTNYVPNDAAINATYTNSANSEWGPASLNWREFGSAYQVISANYPLKIVAYTHTSNDFYLGIAIDHLLRGGATAKGKSSIMLARVAENIPSDITTNPEFTWCFVGFAADPDDMGPGHFCGVAQNSLTNSFRLNNMTGFYYRPASDLSTPYLTLESLNGASSNNDAVAQAIGGCGSYPYMQDLSGMTVLYKNNPVYLISGTTGRSTTNLPIGRYMGNLHSDIAWGPGSYFGPLESRIVVAANSEEYEALGSRPWASLISSTFAPSACPYFRVV